MNFKSIKTVTIGVALAALTSGCEYYNEGARHSLAPEKTLVESDTTIPASSEGITVVPEDAAEAVNAVNTVEQPQDVPSAGDQPEDDSGEVVGDELGDDSAGRPERDHGDGEEGTGEEGIQMYPTRLSPARSSSPTVVDVTFDPYKEDILVTFSEAIDVGMMQVLHSAHLWKEMLANCTDEAPFSPTGCLTLVDVVGAVTVVDARTIRIDSENQSRDYTVSLVLLGADVEVGRAIRDLEGNLMGKAAVYTIKRSCGYPIEEIMSGDAFAFDSKMECKGDAILQP